MKKTVWSDTTFEEKINAIAPLDIEAMDEAQVRMDALCKPIGSLGELEEIAVQLAGITGQVENDLTKKAMVVFAADNGIWEEKISPLPQSITLVQTQNMVKGITGVCVLAKQAGADVRIVDIGINTREPVEGVIDKKIMRGTYSIAQGPAMSRIEAERAIMIGFDMAQELKEQGYAMVAPGEMGICNTSTASAVLCALTGAAPEETTGKGAGLDETTFQRKIEVIKKALKKNKPQDGDVVDVLCKVGGLDIAAMTGFYLGAAFARMPVVIDGVISIAAALCAYRINPLCRQYMFASHHSLEKGYAVAQKTLDVQNLINVHLRLGEGSGCPLAFFVIESAAHIMTDMGTFEQANIDAEDMVDIR
ncbi:MAG: nicotinate-nucleotide--dimethylbenzimidazole phosphoribosyltransferase [Christensenellales bacterium]|jgi:nicotinate-nucleotide--dimethylbenzimidazole phosphoribosyltransferase